jgi:hypothetical protein
MRRFLALALLCVALLLSGCDRPAAEQKPARPAPAGAPQATQPAGSDNSDVSSLLNDVDKQLNSDDQPPADQD